MLVWVGNNWEYRPLQVKRGSESVGSAGRGRGGEIPLLGKFSRWRKNDQEQAQSKEYMRSSTESDLQSLFYGIYHEVRAAAVINNDTGHAQFFERERANSSMQVGRWTK